MAAVADPKPKQTRCRREPWLAKWVRRCECSPRRFQIRVPAGSCKKGIYPTNFGSYPSEAEASRVARLVRKDMARGLELWAILHRLIASGDVPTTITTRIVIPVPSGGYRIQARSRGREIDLPGPFRTALEAREAARRELRRINQAESTAKPNSRTHARFACGPSRNTPAQSQSP